FEQWVLSNTHSTRRQGKDSVYGLYQFEVLPMGLMNAPPTFQRVMNNIIGYKRWDYVLVYLDDILIFSNSFDEHMKHLQDVFNVLSEHRFTLNPDKCSLAKQLNF
ncbi:unnamed protein product, partial [Didymodactylos carnosus]